LVADSTRQKRHYEAIHSAYERHYYDAASMAYRERFIYEPLFADLALDGGTIADLACGSGHNSVALRRYFPRARTVGYDISSSACDAYRRNTGAEAFEVDLTAPVENPMQHDAAIVIGGLHHCVSGLQMALRNIASMVRPGGHLLMMEPNGQFMLDALRQVWYRRDRWFDADTEAPLVHDELLHAARDWFEPLRVEFFGGPAFYLVLNSLETRVPLKVKPALARALLPIESGWSWLSSRRLSPAFLAVWRRCGVGEASSPHRHSEGADAAPRPK
jgi:SAM-dependent methyltransferase